jgi:hypothetical protein
MAFLFLFRFIVAHVNRAAAGDAGREQNERTMGVNRKSFGKFLEVRSLSILPANADGDLHQHALAAATRPRVRGCVRKLSHNNLYYTRQRGIVESISQRRSQTRYGVS